MAKTIYLEPDLVPGWLKQADGYNGRKFRVEVCERVHIPATAELWEGGSKDSYLAYDMIGGACIGQVRNVFETGRTNDSDVAIPENVVIVRHSWIMGKDSGLTFYVRASNAQPLLAAQSATPDLSEEYRKALYIWHGYKPQFRAEYLTHELGWNTTHINEFKAQMLDAGLMRANGALTPAGKTIAANSRF